MAVKEAEVSNLYARPEADAVLVEELPGDRDRDRIDRAVLAATMPGEIAWPARGVGVGSARDVHRRAALAAGARTAAGGAIQH